MAEKSPNERPPAERSLGEVVRDDAKVVAVRLAALQLVSTAKVPMGAAIQKTMKGSSPETKEMITALLDSPVGDALVAGALSGVMHMVQVPGITAQNRRALSDELRYTGETALANMLLSSLMEPVRAALAQALSGIQAVDGAFSAPQLSESRAAPTAAASREEQPVRG